jgi:hypothetical protein
MKKIILGSMLMASAVLLAAPAANAQQGAAGGAVGGAIVGGAVGGPVGAAAGATVGAAVGGISDETKFRGYVVERRHPSYRYSNELNVGVVLPESGVTYYEVPREYGTTEYRYTVVNDRTVLVDPRTRKVVRIIQ